MAEIFGTFGSDTLIARFADIVYGLGGDDTLETQFSFSQSSGGFLLGGAGNDTYDIGPIHLPGSLKLVTMLTTISNFPPLFFQTPFLKSHHSGK